MKSLTKLVVILSLVVMTGCLNEDENEDPISSGSAGIPDINAICTLAECDAGSSGDGVFIAWGTGMSDCSDFAGDVYVSSTVTCDGSGCLASATSGWLNDLDDSPASSRAAGSTTSAVWMDLNPGNPVDDPGSGDVICCAASVSGNATLTDADCSAIP